MNSGQLTSFPPGYWQNFSYNNYEERIYSMEKSAEVSARIANFKDQYLSLGAMMAAKEHFNLLSRKTEKPTANTTVWKSLKTEKSRLAYWQNRCAIVWLGVETMILQADSDLSADVWSKLVHDILSEYRTAPSPRPRELSLLLREETDIKQLRFFDSADSGKWASLSGFFYVFWNAQSAEVSGHADDTFFGFKNFQSPKLAEEFLYQLTHTLDKQTMQVSEKFIYTQWRSKSLQQDYRITLRKTAAFSQYFFQHESNIFTFYGNFDDQSVQNEIEKILSTL